MAIAVSLSGCLITQPVHFDQPANSPPSISDGPSPAPSIHGILRLASTMTMTTDAGLPTTSFVPFEVVVVDPDVDQTLNYIVEIDGNLTSDVGGDIGPSPALMGRERRSFHFNVITGLFGAGAACHRVDLFVSGRFQVNHTPHEPNDVAQATWWILWAPDPTTSSVELRSCQ